MTAPSTATHDERHPGAVDVTVLICTCNRADDLSDTLQSLAAIDASPYTWDVLVVDNNSTDRTAAVIAEWAKTYPVPLRSAFEPRQGKSFALNSGISLAKGRIIAFTDDDVRVPADWLRRIVDGMERYGCDYSGGRVIPLWEYEPPSWFPRTNGLMWGVVALLDYGPEPIRLDRRVPLGVNMAVRRDAFDRVGGFDTRLGRRSGTLLGQEQREWCLRARAAGVVGYYLPDVVVQHLIPAKRLTKRYFRQWFYWRGISRAIIYAQTGADMEYPQSSTLEFRSLPHIAGVPRYLYRSAWCAACDTVVERLRNRRTESFERELWLWSFAGIVRQRWADRRIAPGSVGTIKPQGCASAPASVAALPRNEKRSA
jgi:glucosyl-dolichyl phosphate glucuronosyltransferase